MYIYAGLQLDEKVVSGIHFQPFATDSEGLGEFSN